ncbi:MAG: phosphoglycerate kinase [Candidatus Pacebacteria bacterium]|nr:phosphoglycerate kinase [Candidatus Paceibacterota bacterium]
MFRSLNDYNFFNKKVLVRCDFNVSIEKGKVIDNFKIKKIIKTLAFLKESGAKIILISHLEKEGWKKPTLKPVVLVLSELLQSPVFFAKSCLGKKTKRMAEKLKAGEILLLENLRRKKEEKKNGQKFSRELAQLADVYVGEAFSACHRPHASIVGVPRHLPHFIGFECEQEVKVLSSIIENPQRPLAVLIGGAKVASKLEIIGKFLSLADYLLFGGKTANVLLIVKGIALGRVWPGAEVAENLKKISLTDSKIHLPLDVIASCDEKGEIVRQTAPAKVRKDEEIYDIGPSTIEKFSEIIKTAKTIFWSGDMGMVENPKFRQGTTAIANAIVNNKAALKVAGGGETVAFIRAQGLEEEFSYLSMGGGALLEFIAKGTLPGIEALKI